MTTHFGSASFGALRPDRRRGNMPPKRRKSGLENKPGPSTNDGLTGGASSSAPSGILAACLAVAATPAYDVDSDPTCSFLGASWHADLLTSYNVALAELLEYWPDIDQADPIPIQEGGSQAWSPPYRSLQLQQDSCFCSQAGFEPKLAKAALSEGISEEYRCAGNFFKCDLNFNPDPNAPGLF